MIRYSPADSPCERKQKLMSTHLFSLGYTIVLDKSDSGPSLLWGDSFHGRGNPYGFQHKKKNKVDTKTCHIVAYNGSITYSHGVITRVRHKKTTLATNLSKVSRKKKCYISTTYKIVKIIALHFTIIRHYMYIRGTT